MINYPNLCVGINLRLHHKWELSKKLIDSKTVVILCYLVIKLTFIALIADFVIWVIFALEIGGLYSFSEYS